MKRIIIKKIILTVLFVLISITIAFADNSPKAIVDAVYNSVSNHVTVTVSIKNNPGIICFKSALCYDSNVFNLVRYYDSGLLKGCQVSTDAIDLKNNPFILMWYDYTSFSTNNLKDGELIKLEFDVIGNTSGDYTFSLVNDARNTKNADSEQIEFDAVSDTVSIKKQNFYLKNNYLHLYPVSSLYQHVAIYNDNGKMISCSMLAPNRENTIDTNVLSGSKIKIFYCDSEYNASSKSVILLTKNVGASPITRLDFCEQLVNIMGYDTSSYSEKDYPFVDCGSLSDQQKKAIAYCYQHGLAYANSDNLFNANHTFSRAEVITLLSLIAQPPVFSEQSCFGDIGESYWYTSYIKNMYGIGIIDESVNFLPLEYAGKTDTVQWITRTKAYVVNH